MIGFERARRFSRAVQRHQPVILSDDWSLRPKRKDQPQWKNLLSANRRDLPLLSLLSRFVMLSEVGRIAKQSGLRSRRFPTAIAQPEGVPAFLDVLHGSLVRAIPPSNTCNLAARVRLPNRG